MDHIGDLALDLGIFALDGELQGGRTMNEAAGPDSDREDREKTQGDRQQKKAQYIGPRLTGRKA